MVPIIIATVAIVMFLLILLVAGIVVIINIIRKKKSVNKGVAILLVITVVFFSLIALDASLIGNKLTYNKERNREQAMDKAENFGEGLVVSYDMFKKTWDTRAVAKLNNIGVTISSSTFTVANDIKTYTINIVFDNKNSTADSMSLTEIVGSNYLMGCDSSDIVHAIKSKKYETTKLPVGKSEAAFTIETKKDVDLAYMRLGDRRFVLK